MPSAMEENLQKAIRLYKALLTGYQRVAQCLESRRIEAMYESMASMNELMEEIEAVRLALEQDPAPLDINDETVARLFSELNRLMAEASDANKSLGEKALAARAVLADEIERTGKNREAVEEYGGRRETTGGRLDIPSV
ncbi:MAG: hypothetical protein K9K82_08615 [Desulfobacteraceae bacterium]|nr:hypothetical protein [Desulfobacteraceae bacterium]